MNQLKITNLVVWITIGLIGIGLTAHKGIFALMKARQAALELHGTISNSARSAAGTACSNAPEGGEGEGGGLGLSACSDDFVALIKARHATSEARGTI